MHWVSHPPTAPGWYWWQADGFRAAVRVSVTPGGLWWVAGPASSVGCRPVSEVLAEFPGSEWAGPLPEPADPPG